MRINKTKVEPSFPVNILYIWIVIAIGRLHHLDWLMNYYYKSSNYRRDIRNNLFKNEKCNLGILSLFQIQNIFFVVSFSVSIIKTNTKCLFLKMLITYSYFKLNRIPKHLTCFFFILFEYCKMQFVLLRLIVRNQYILKYSI